MTYITKIEWVRNYGIHKKGDIETKKYESFAHFYQCMKECSWCRSFIILEQGYFKKRGVTK